MIKDSDPEIRKSGVKQLADRVCFLECRVKADEDTVEEYEEFKKSLTCLIDIVLDSKDKELIKTALENITSIDLLRALPGYKTRDGKEPAEDIKKSIGERIHELLCRNEKL
ncbi:MAG: hypothetical protein QXT45_05685 [Candidatus Bilamarchaeaceae archaeon]